VETCLRDLKGIIFSLEPFFEGKGIFLGREKERRARETQRERERKRGSADVKITRCTSADVM